MSAHVLRGVVAWSETDASERVHYTAIMRWVENAEHDYYRRTALAWPLRQLPRRAISATYYKPFFAGDPFTVFIGLQRLGESSITYAWHVMNGDLIAAEGTYVVVHVDENGKPSRLTPTMRETLSRIDWGRDPGVGV